jgi:Arc/MetJ-type ribon-helix-helix transcriptional regulator
MKLSVSLPEKDVEFLDHYLTMHDLESRSAALQAALRALRDLELEDQYTATFQEKEDPAWTESWHTVWVETGGSQFAERPAQ